MLLKKCFTKMSNRLSLTFRIKKNSILKSKYGHFVDSACSLWKLNSADFNIYCSSRLIVLFKWSSTLHTAKNDQSTWYFWNCPTFIHNSINTNPMYHFDIYMYISTYTNHRLRRRKICILHIIIKRSKTFNIMMIFNYIYALHSI